MNLDYEIQTLMKDLESDSVERTNSLKSIAIIEEERMLTERRSSLAKTFDTNPYIGSSLSDLNTDLFKTFYLPKEIIPGIEFEKEFKKCLCLNL